MEVVCEFFWPISLSESALRHDSTSETAREETTKQGMEAGHDKEKEKLRKERTSRLQPLGLLMQRLSLSLSLSLSDEAHFLPCSLINSSF